MQQKEKAPKLPKHSEWCSQNEAQSDWRSPLWAAAGSTPRVTNGMDFSVA